MSSSSPDTITPWSLDLREGETGLCYFWLYWAEIRVGSITNCAKPTAGKQETQTQRHRHTEKDTQREGQVNQ